METKTVIFDGGPLDCEMRDIDKSQKKYICYGHDPDLTKHSAYVQLIEHIYLEDETLEGLFIYQGKKQQST